MSQLTPESAFTDVSNRWLWIFVVLTMAGVIVGNIRSIAMQTLVTALIEEDRRDKANGLVGTATGVAASRPQLETDGLPSKVSRVFRPRAPATVSGQRSPVPSC